MTGRFDEATICAKDSIMSTSTAQISSSPPTINVRGFTAMILVSIFELASKSFAKTVRIYSAVPVYPPS